MFPKGAQPVTLFSPFSDRETREFGGHRCFSAVAELLVLMMTAVSCCWRYAYTGDAVAGHSTDAWQRSYVVLLRLLHIRHHRRSTLVGTPAKSMLPRPSRKHINCRVCTAVYVGHYAGPGVVVPAKCGVATIQSPNKFKMAPPISSAPYTLSTFSIWYLLRAYSSI